MDLKNKKITVMGLGLHGGGIAAVNYLTAHGALVTVTDLKNKKELRESLEALKHPTRIRLVLGKHRLSDFITTDMVVKNPGVPLKSPFVTAARKKGVAIENELSLFLKACPATVIGITGTRGKSTTTWSLYQLLQGGRTKVWFAGLPKRPMLDIVDRVGKNDIVVLELSSWQLELLSHHRLSPSISLITNIYPDHLKSHGGLTPYIKAKENIFLHQTSRDVVVLNRDIPELRRSGTKAVSRRYWFSLKPFSEENGCFLRNGGIIFRENGHERRIGSSRDVALPGMHNMANVLGAICVAAVLGVTPLEIRRHLRTLTGLPARIELIKTVQGVNYVNDTTATSPDGTIAALRTLPKKKIILIAGGVNKGFSPEKMRQLAAAIKKTCKAVVLFDGSASDILKRNLQSIGFAPFVANVSSMEAAVNLARSFARRGDVVVLSPSASSFNMFINEYDRGDQFVAMVKQW